MPFGLDDLAFLLLSASSAKQLATKPPEGADVSAAVAGASQPGQQAESLFGVPPVASKAPGALDLSGLTDALEPAVQQLAALGPAPTVPLQAPTIPVPQVQLPPVGGLGQQPVGPPTVPQAPPPGPVGPPAPAPATPPPDSGIGATLASIPGALESVSSLLGIGQPEARDIPAPAAGGPGGQVVPGFDLPAGITIADILSQIPRFR